MIPAKESARLARAEARKATATLRWVRTQGGESEVELRGADGISLVHQLTLASWAWSGKPLSRLERRVWPVRFLTGFEP